MSEKSAKTGRYEVAAELGRGSMGIVHRAHDPVMGRDVAIKTILLPSGLPEDRREEFQERFLREAQAAGRLSHPGIVTVYDFNQGPDDGLPFIAMEYVEGPTLHELICKEGALSPDWALSMAETLADALHSAHRAGIVHRDLKPANILVREADGLAKIADFGVARVNVSDLTDAGTTYGSPAYMAPERLKGGRADARSDLFSLAVILFETLCGQRPFGGDDFASICSCILNDEAVPIRKHMPDLTPIINDFFTRALDKDPDRRFQDGAEFCEALRAVREDQAQFRSGASTMMVSFSDDTQEPAVVELPAPPPPPKAIAVQRETTQESWRGVRDRWIVIGGAAVLLTLLSFVSGWMLRDFGPAEAQRPDATVRATQSPPEPTLASWPLGAAEAGAEELLADAIGPVLVTSEKLAPAESVTSESSVETEPLRVAASTAEKPLPASSAKPSSTKAKAQTTSRTRPPVADEKPAPATASVPVMQTDPVSTTIAETGLPETAAAEGSGGEPAAAPPVGAGEPGYLEVSIKSSVKAGKLTVRVDGEKVFSTKLATEDRKLNRIYKRALRQVQQTLDTRLEMPPGTHTLTVEVFSEARSRSFEESLEVELEPGQQRGLQITAGRTFGRRLALILD